MRSPHEPAGALRAKASLKWLAQVKRAMLGWARARRGRPAAVLLAAAVALSAVAVGQGDGEDAYLPEPLTTCWPCHVGWSTPLKSMYDIVPPETAGGPLGTPFDYTVRVRNPWLADLVYFEPTLDLSSAPSLAFVSDQAPLDLTVPGAIEADPLAPTTPQRSFVTVHVPEGASALSITLVPGNQDGNFGPDLAMRLYPGLSQPEGEPQFTVDASGPGGAEAFDVPDPAAFRERGLSYGNWTVEAEYVALRTDGESPTFSPTQGLVTFDVDLHASFELGDDPAQSLNRRTTVEPDGSTLFRWRLQALGAPGVGERVLLTVNATAYYQHKSEANDNEANFTKSLHVPVVAKDGGAALEPESAIVVGAPPTVGVSLVRISEAVGYASAFLLIASVWTGGMFGKASRRQLNHVFGSAKRRVAFHNFLSYGLTAAALAHLVLFVVETAYYWTFGLIWGGLGILAMFGLGVTGALQVPMIRRWNYAAWRWSHYALAVAAIAFTLAHMLLDGANFAAIQGALGWEGGLQDPLDPRNVT